MLCHISDVVGGGKKKYLIKDGAVQRGHTLSYSPLFNSPQIIDGYVDTRGNRAVGFDNIDFTGYTWLKADWFFPQSKPASCALNAVAGGTVANQYQNTQGRFESMVKLPAGKGCVCLCTGTSGENVNALIRNLYLV